ncbi:evasin-1-like [Dermacentor silvarum]|uniref:evasin-1-like n=1 Tax=Dermacentor silvarum TaxID=543639 RepID=UPI002100AA0A|nr:evasin-1-like [Dermacentor silvarum]
MDAHNMKPFTSFIRTMNAFIYATAICFVLLAACEPHHGAFSNEAHDESSSSDEGDDYSGGCPFYVAENKTGFGTPVQCEHECQNTTETLENNTRCYDIGDDVLFRMTPDLPYACPIGTCNKGICVRNGKNETCYRRNRQNHHE